ncbi:MAG: helix-turn-helix domain-containing protein [Caldilineaceae bacterium]
MADHDFQEKMIALVRAFGWHRPAETPCGQPVTIAEAHALLEIARADGISQNELTVSLNLAKSTVSRLISKIERRGWVQRQQNEQDRRGLPALFD